MFFFYKHSFILGNIFYSFVLQFAAHTEVDTHCESLNTSFETCYNDKQSSGHNHFSQLRVAHYVINISALMSQN